eukprot:CAMPEP_0175054010 /NCGR_PEP_ID=MMETSP0052_2-20121109/9255_1 /TAXON_ID=51329 ORGANISM="Polytomella parva, Strain SAG 63-3" /NCGR_SAMPLE_ID=MMETSP0052_2 /ASSEMBLY_ACC=CAM_ASM_000194 /LENGTH=785 /DNA_ID=CAMNT_0016318633 /DNA_START=502 /DNA_END=2859 /DNA_ORIENTATION=-
MCANRACSVCECGDSEIPQPWKEFESKSAKPTPETNSLPSSPTESPSSLSSSNAPPESLSVDSSEAAAAISCPSHLSSKRRLVLSSLFSPSSSAPSTTTPTSPALAAENQIHIPSTDELSTLSGSDSSSSFTAHVDAAISKRSSDVDSSLSQSSPYEDSGKVDRRLNFQTAARLLNLRGWRGYNNPWMAEGDEDEEYLYINLLANPERFTGYAGEHAHRIWAEIYTRVLQATSEAAVAAAANKNKSSMVAAGRTPSPFFSAGPSAMGSGGSGGGGGGGDGGVFPSSSSLATPYGIDRSRTSILKGVLGGGGGDPRHWDRTILGPKGSDQRAESRVFYRLVSGIHTSISAHISRHYLIDERAGVWGVNLTDFRRRLGDPVMHRGRVENLYFSYLFVLRAVTKALPLIDRFHLSTGLPDEDTRTRELLTQFRDTPELREACPSPFDEGRLWKGRDSELLQGRLREAFQGITRVMDCVGCEKCKLWGKLQTLGVATALKVVFSAKDCGGNGGLGESRQVPRSQGYTGMTHTCNGGGDNSNSNSSSSSSGSNSSSNDGSSSNSNGSSDDGNSSHRHENDPTKAVLPDLVLERNEVIALINLLERLSSSIRYVNEMAVMLQEQDERIQEKKMKWRMETLEEEEEDDEDDEDDEYCSEDSELGAKGLDRYDSDIDKDDNCGIGSSCDIGSIDTTKNLETNIHKKELSDTDEKTDVGEGLKKDFNSLYVDADDNDLSSEVVFDDGFGYSDFEESYHIDSEVLDSSAGCSEEMCTMDWDDIGSEEEGSLHDEL